MLSNGVIAELLARAGEDSEGHRRRAYLKASAAALLWPVEAADVLREGGSLTDLDGLGPRLSAKVASWIEDPPELDRVPEVRRGFMTFAEARAALADEPSWRAALRGDLQMHTTYSDGKASVEEMALSAANMAYDYVAITDHSKGLKIARGMDEAQLQEQGREIERVNESLSAQGLELRVLSSVEMNLDSEGEGDMDSRALDGLDIVVGSFHSGLRDEADQTDRYLKALRNPQVNVIGHPGTRRFNRRTGLQARWDRVFEAARELDVALEINSHPHRQDLEPELLDLARDAGVRLSIGTDAHSIAELSYVDIGLVGALRKGIRPDRIVNFLPRDQLLQWSR